MILKLFSYIKHFIRCMLKNSSSIQSVTLTLLCWCNWPEERIFGKSTYKPCRKSDIFLSFIYTDMLIEIGQTMNKFND